MKKAFKLVWMVLFALPLISLTACGDDDEPEVDVDGTVVKFKDYSDLLDKTRDDVMKKMNIEVTETDEYGIYYEDVNEAHIQEVDIFYTFFEDNEFNATQTYQKSVLVEVDVYGYENYQLYDYLTKLYGKATMNQYGYYEMEKGDMYVWYEYDEDDGIGEIDYVSKKEFDKIRTKGADINPKAAIKAHRAK